MYINMIHAHTKELLGVERMREGHTHAHTHTHTHTNIEAHM